MNKDQEGQTLKLGDVTPRLSLPISNKYKNLSLGMPSHLTPTNTTRKLAIGGRCFCGAPNLPCATDNILWRIFGDAPHKIEDFSGACLPRAPLNWYFLWRTGAHAPQKTCGPHHQRLDGILPHLFRGACSLMRHKKSDFSGASGRMRHRILCGPGTNNWGEVFLWRM